MRSAFFHEDDFGQLELLPLANLPFCLQQAEAISDFGGTHQSGIGWTDIYVREGAPTSLKTLGITPAAVRAALSAVLPEYDIVYTGYASHREIAAGTLAFGTDAGPALFCSVLDTVTIDAIWCSDPMPELLLLPSAEKLLFVDWAWNFVCPLQESARFQHYIEHRGETIETFNLHQKDEQTSPRPRAWWKFW